jgi:hypothetical protein
MVRHEVRYILTDVSEMLTAFIIRAMEAENVFEMSVNDYRTTRNKLEHRYLHIHLRKNFKSQPFNIHVACAIALRKKSIVDFRTRLRQ